MERMGLDLFMWLLLFEGVQGVCFLFSMKTSIQSHCINISSIIAVVVPCELKMHVRIITNDAM